jgi:hypothetical protein
MSPRTKYTEYTLTGPSYLHGWLGPLASFFLVCQRSQVTSASWLCLGDPLSEQTQLPMSSSCSPEARAPWGIERPLPHVAFLGTTPIDERCPWPTTDGQYKQAQAIGGDCRDRRPTRQLSCDARSHQRQCVPHK